ncbi:MAG: hypothetical protein MJ137_05320, partial [Clostridia bacterium]|nr:hypothetical protein [Clostridia bacterium]
MKKVISFLLMLALLCAFSVPALADKFEVPPATDQNIKKAVDVLVGSVESLDDVFDETQSKSIIEVIREFGATFKSATSYVAAINSSVTFLKMIGVVKDRNAAALKGIMQQMTVISEQITEMDKKIDRLTEKMDEFRASAEFNARTEKAILFETAWKDFEFRYMEDGMDKLITHYNSMMLKGLQLWCQNEGNTRSANGMDNTSICLCYEKADGDYKLIYTTQNGLPDSASEDTRVLVLDGSVLPQSISWNVNTYRDSIKKAIVSRLKEKDVLAALQVRNFPELVSDTEPDENLLSQIAEDAINLLTYRITACQVNEDPEFALQVLSQFSNYCSHLVGTNDGVDAIAKVMFLTHAFEYQIKDDYTDFMNQMTVKSGVYGSFVLNVLGMSDFITDAEKSSALDLYCNAILSIEKKKTEGLTGSDRYCYVTNQYLYFGSISFTESAEIKVKHRGSVRGYENYSAKDTEIAIRYGLTNNKGNVSQLIGDSDAILLGYYLGSNQIKIGFDFLNDHLGNDALRDYGATVVSLNGTQSFPTNNGTSLAVTNVIGSYFDGKSTTKLNSLPSGADTDDLVYRKMMTGSLMNTSTGNVSANTVLSAIAVYGESHWYWEKDEAA